MKRLLENRQFVTSKCVAGYVVALINDYDLLFDHELYSDLSNTSSVKQIYQFLKTSLHYLKKQPTFVYQLAINYNEHVSKLFCKNPTQQGNK